MKTAATLIVVGTLVVIAACADVTADSGADRARLIAERVAFKDRTAGFDIEKFDCPARTVSDQTVETSLLLWVNERSDMTTQDELKVASDDFVDAFVACGASEAQIASELGQSDDAMMQSSVMAVLQKGRGLK